MADGEPIYLTVRELAALLRVGERRIYALAASGEIPCSKATGKLLFPRTAVDAWIAAHTDGGGDIILPAQTSLAQSLSQNPDYRPPPIVVGSHDPLFDWALRESGSGLASFLDGSLDGLDRFARREAAIAGLHLQDTDTGDWNIGAVTARFGDWPVVLLEWAWRERGLILGADVTPGVFGLADLAGRTGVSRQSPSGGHAATAHLLRQAGMSETDFGWTDAAARTETDVATTIRDGLADFGIGLACVARQHGLEFAPLMWERFDLLVSRRFAFEPPMQRVLCFARGSVFHAQAARLGGYRTDGTGQVHFNGP